MHNLWVDIRYALRRLRKTPGFTVTAVLTLAFGIGATTAIFSIVEGVLLRPLPFPHPDRLVVLSDVLEGAKFGTGNNEAGVTAPEIPVYEHDTRSFAALGAYRQTGWELTGAGAPAQISAARLTASIFQVLQVSPLMGRVFTQEEDTGHAQVVVISYAMWHSRFHGDPQIIGRKIELDRKTYEIIGVMPRGFEFPLIPGQLNQSELWTPMSFTRDEKERHGSGELELCHGGPAETWRDGGAGTAGCRKRGKADRARISSVYEQPAHPRRRALTRSRHSGAGAAADSHVISRGRCGALYRVRESGGASAGACDTAAARNCGAAGDGCKLHGSGTAEPD